MVVWLKDNLPVKNTQHYNIITTTNPGEDDLIVSNLNINTITSEDEGTYTCYCYYNRTMVTSNKYVVSNEVFTTLHFGKGLDNYVCYFICVYFTTLESSSSDNTWIIPAASLSAVVGLVILLGLLVYCWLAGRSNKG